MAPVFRPAICKCMPWRWPSPVLSAWLFCHGLRGWWFHRGLRLVYLMQSPSRNGKCIVFNTFDEKFFRFGWQPGLPPRSGRPSQRSTLRVLWSCPPTLGPRCLELTEWMSTEHCKNLSLSCHIKASRKPNLGCVSKRKLFGWNLLRKQLGVRCLLLCMLHCIVTV